MNMPHKLANLKDIIEVVNEDNIEVFLSDFSEWLALEVVLKGNEVIKTGDRGVMTWNDDGIKGISKITIDFKANP